MDNIGELARQIGLIIEPVIAGVVKQLKPSDDLITLTSARKMFGEAFIERNANKGNIDFYPTGKRSLLSRSQLELLRSAEKFNPSQFHCVRKSNR